jgi:hypothetical protein
MNNFFYKTVLLTGLLLNSLFVFPQTKEKEENAIDEQHEVVKQHNLNGHYLSIGNIFLSSGYYGLMGLGYEYRHGVFGANTSFGLYYYGFGANVGCKFYLSNKKRFVKNLYFNVLPFCYFGKIEHYYHYYIEGDNNSIIRVDEWKSKPLFGAKILFGYSPTWHVSKRVSLGFNINIGGNIGYDNDGFIVVEGDIGLSPINFDLGFVVKFDGKLK